MGVTKTEQDIFMPQETQENPFDITLVVEDGKEFKAHRKLLSEASPFFEKLLNTDMMESKKGVARLEMLTKAGLAAVLGFIYTGDLQILTEDDARGLIEMADYLFILPLKTLAGRVLAQTLNTSNCISTYYFAERYRCEQLTSDVKKFVHSNFTNVAKAEEFLNMSSEEVNQWISSDGINVSTEEDVFKIILTWIDHNKSERKKYFADLFRQVRLIYISRDYLLNDIVTNDLVNDNACCIELVKAAMKATDTKNSKNVSFPPPRKSLETPVIVVRAGIREEDEQLLCYVPRTNTWYKLSDFSPPPMKQMVSCHGTLYTLFKSWTLERDYKLLRYAMIHSLIDGLTGPEQVSEFSPCGKQHLSYITKFNPESNSWEDIATFDFGLRRGICIVAKDNFIYFIGGRVEGTYMFLADVDRYDLIERKWDKLADLREGRDSASGTATHGKIFIGGGNWANCYECAGCEVYNETTNEWQVIATPSIFSPSFGGSIMCVDDKVYAVDILYHDGRGRGKIECYDPDENEWNFITKIPVPNVLHERVVYVCSCSMRGFLGGNFQWTQVIT
ncbi:hypothetical protein ACROYT_G044627 [Oculina patagonica]